MRPDSGVGGGDDLWAEGPPVPSDRVVRGQLGETAILFGLDDRRLRYLNDSAAAIWDGLTRRQSLSAMVSLLSDRFGADEAVVRADVDQMIRGLADSGILVPSPGDSVSDTSARGIAARLRPAIGTASWPASGSYRALGATIRIETREAELGDVIAEVLTPLKTTEAAEYAIRIEHDGRDRWTVATRDDGAATVTDRAAAVARVLGEVNGAAVESVPDWLVLHAGAVASDHGTVVLAAGPNHGKSTLTAGLVKAGLAYLTDEAAAIDHEGVCHPYPKPIALDPGSFAVHWDLEPPRRDGLAGEIDAKAWYVDPERIGSLGPASPVIAIVIPRWISGATTVMSHCSREDALSVLVGNSFDFQAGGQRVFEILCDLVDRVPVWRLAYGNGNEAVAAVRDLLAATPVAQKIRG